MTFLIIIFLISLLGGQLTGITLWPGVVVYAHDIALVVLMAYAYATKKIENTKLQLRAPILLFFFGAVVSLTLNAYRFTLQELFLGSLYLVRWLIYAHIYILVAQKNVHFAWRQWLYWLGVGFGILGLLQYFLYPDLRNLVYLGWDPHYYRLFSTILDPNFAGIIFVLGFLLGLALWERKRIRLFLFLSQAILFTSILLTYSRSTYVAFLVGIVSMMAMKKQTIVALGLIALFVVAITILPLRNVDILRLDRSETANARVGNWQRSFWLISGSPILGYGFNTLAAVQRNRGWTDDSVQVSRAGAGVDNSFLFLLATTGVFGFGAYLWLLWKMKKLAFIGEQTMKAASLGSIAAVIAHAQFINSLFYPWVMIWLWVLFGYVEYTTKTQVCT